MRNKDLIELLQKQPDNATVWVLNSKGSAFGQVTAVETVMRDTIGTDGKVTTTQVDVHLETNV